MTKDMQARLTVWPVTALAFLGHGYLDYQALPLQRNLQNWLEIGHSWSHGSARWAAILLGLPLFALFLAGILLIVRVSAIAFKAITNGWL
ncbi:MAG TPA: hypothetical protein VG166_09885 [Caulobacteraceae bacterium]|jgi:hypothetical protein|nr:hypothetical protein [Caulobacteraceae bacterium]